MYEKLDDLAIEERILELEDKRDLTNVITNFGLSLGVFATVSEFMNIFSMGVMDKYRNSILTLGDSVSEYLPIYGVDEIFNPSSVDLFLKIPYLIQHNVLPPLFATSFLISIPGLLYLKKCENELKKLDPNYDENNQ